MQVTFRGQVKENVIPGVDKTPDTALQMAQLYLEAYGPAAATAAQHNVTEGFIIYFSDARDDVQGVHFNATDPATTDEILQMFGFKSFGDGAQDGTTTTWIKTPDELSGDVQQ